ncbi:M23 family metallopeptidase [Gordonia malaquae]|uniref:M23 family metallopeptidase n=1 Tax=Gordonia malaquae TaxID=410332 RepID=UPI003AFA8BF2
MHHVRYWVRTALVCLGLAGAVAVGSLSPASATAEAANGVDGHVVGELANIVQDSVRAVAGPDGLETLLAPMAAVTSCLTVSADAGPAAGDQVGALGCFAAAGAAFGGQVPLVLDAFPVGRLLATLAAAVAPHDPSIVHGGSTDRATPDGILPAPGQRAVAPTPGGFLTSTFGDGRGHQGIDIGNRLGAPILAVEDGEVINSGPAEGFGLWIRIRHADGTVTTYGHNDQNSVNIGDRVRVSQQIGTVGSRGVSSGPHVHFEVADPAGTAIDPLPWLQARGVTISTEASQPPPAAPSDAPILAREQVRDRRP